MTEEVVTIVKQVLLSTGDEIVCEVVDWNDDEGPGLVIRNPLKVVTVDRPDGLRYHIFRPVMIMQLEEGTFQTLNAEHILIEATPVKEVVREYYNALNVENDERTPVDGDEKFKKYMKKITAILDGEDEDSDNDNVIKLFPGPGKNKLH